MVLLPSIHCVVVGMVFCSGVALVVVAATIRAFFVVSRGFSNPATHPLGSKTGGYFFPLLIPLYTPGNPLSTLFLYFFDFFS